MKHPLEDDPEMIMVRKHLDQLMEHFDSVHIFCTRHEPDGTVNVSIGAGNWFARYGQISEWLCKEQEAARKTVRGPEDEA